MLLNNGNVLSWNLNTEISTSNHQTVRNFKNFVEVINAFLVFDFTDDLDVRRVVAL
ncbi:hypothetical protein D3C85_1308070 [compost metagenome]